MPSLVVDGLLCLLLLCGAYILFGRQSASAESQKKTTKKKKRSKASKTAKAQDETTDAAAQVPKASAEGSSARPVSRAVDGTTRQNGHEQQPATTQSRKGERSTQSNSALVKNDGQEEDFPPLSSSRDAVHANTAKQIPLAERLAKTHPKTAVDDMVEKDDALQGKKVYSRTMRIVKPQESKPLLLDNSTNDDDEWENTGQESLKESAWQSVPLSTKKPSALRIPHTSNNQVSSQTPSRSIPGLPELTKKQRQNARKAAEAKAAKEQAEHDRLQRLAAHKRGLEKERMAQQYKSKGSPGVPQTQKSKREEVGGGMRAAVYDGKLIWE